MEDLGMKTEFWKGKKVLLTGHTGFKGSWLSLWLQSLGAKVIGYSLEPPTKPSLFEVAQVAEGMVASHIGDVRDMTHILKVLKEHSPEIIFHMAAQSLVGYSYENPVETYATNVMGTVHLLDAVRQVGGVKAVINITSDKCYENHEWVWGYRENDPMGGYDPYSNSKGCSELLTAAFRNSFFNPSKLDEHGTAVASVRAGNVIGGGDWAANRLIPDIFRAFTNQQTVIVRHPNAIRPWQHVLEPLHGYLLLAERLWEDGASFCDAWNFGPNDEDAKPVKWIIEQLSLLLNGELSWQQELAEQPHEAMYLKLDCSKAKSSLDWYPSWELATALEKIVEWYQFYQAGENMRDVTVRQIRSYY